MREAVQGASRLIGTCLAVILLKDFEESLAFDEYGSSIIFALF